MPLTRFRNLSDEGLRLYNASIRTTKNKNFLKRLIHNLFWTRYDDKLLEISNSFRESSYTLFSMLDSKIEYIFSNGLRNMIKTILTPKINSRNPVLNVKQNYLFHLDLISTAHKSGDYNTVILCLLALQHPYVDRLNIFNKKIERIFNEIDNNYGNLSNGFIHHLDKIIQNGCNESEIPSIFLYLIYCEDISEFSNIRFNKLKISNILNELNNLRYDFYTVTSINETYVLNYFFSQLKVSIKQ